jgi:hypothetical protein
MTFRGQECSKDIALFGPNHILTELNRRVSAERLNIVFSASFRIADDSLRLLQEIKHPVKRAATSSQFQQYAGIPDHYSLELA